MPGQICELDLIDDFILKKYDAENKLFEVMILKGNEIIEVITDEEKLNAYA